MNSMAKIKLARLRSGGLFVSRAPAKGFILLASACLISGCSHIAMKESLAKFQWWDDKGESIGIHQSAEAKSKPMAEIVEVSSPISTTQLSAGEAASKKNKSVSNANVGARKESVLIPDFNDEVRPVKALDDVVIEVGNKTFAKRSQYKVVETRKVDGFELVDIGSINRLNDQQPTSAGVASNILLNTQFAAEKPKKSLVDIDKSLNLIRQKYQQLVDQHNNLGWTLSETYEDGVFAGCKLTTGTTQLEKTAFTAQLWIEIVGDSLYVNSTADLDAKNAFSGLKLNNDTKINFDRNYSANRLVADNYALKKIISSGEAVVTLSGGELGGDRFEADLFASQLREVHPIMRECNNKIVSETR